MSLRFFRPVIFLTIAVLALLAYPMYAWFSPATNHAIEIGGIVAAVNTVLGFFIIEFSIDKQNATFMVVFLGGMVARIGAILIAFTALIISGVSAQPLTFSMLGFYVAYLIGEVYYVHYEVAARKIRIREYSELEPAFVTA